MLDPRYFRYMSVAPHATPLADAEPQPKSASPDDTAVYAATIPDDLPAA
jgi:hypothetical protein